MFNINKFTMILLATMVLCGGHSHAMEASEAEQRILTKRQEIIKDFLDSEKSIFTELQRLETLESEEKLSQLREFAVKNLNINQSSSGMSTMMGIFALFVKDDSFVAGPEPIEQKLVTQIRKKLADDFAALKSEALPNRLIEEDLPVDEYWKPAQNIQPTTDVTIACGRTALHLLDCFDNKELGDRLPHHEGWGLEVFPSCPEYPTTMTEQDSIFYACAASKQSLDFPALLTGSVQAQYLKPDGESWWSAALKISDLVHIKNPKITLVTSDQIMSSSCVPRHEQINVEEFCKFLPKTLVNRLQVFNHNFFDKKAPALKSTFFLYMLLKRDESSWY